MSEQSKGDSKAPSRGLGFKAVFIGLLIFVLLLGSLALFAWWQGSPEPLPFQYEGF